MDISLRQEPDGLYLCSGDMKMRGDFSEMAGRLKASNLGKELLVRAAKGKKPAEARLVIDATAGMGEDSLLLAAVGFQVLLFEQDPVISALLEDTINRAAKDPFLKEIVNRMELRKEDSISYLMNTKIRPSVIYLDPMFPERTKSSLVKKKFQLIHELQKPCTNEKDLLTAAFEAQPERIVIKRPLNAPCLAGRKPDFSLSGKTIRYDCILGSGTVTT